MPFYLFHSMTPLNFSLTQEQIPTALEQLKKKLQRVQNCPPLFFVEIEKSYLFLVSCLIARARGAATIECKAIVTSEHTRESATTGRYYMAAVQIGQQKYIFHSSASQLQEMVQLFLSDSGALEYFNTQLLIKDRSYLCRARSLRARAFFKTMLTHSLGSTVHEILTSFEVFHNKERAEFLNTHLPQIRAKIEQGTQGLKSRRALEPLATKVASELIFDNPQRLAFQSLTYSTDYSNLALTHDLADIGELDQFAFLTQSYTTANRSEVGHASYRINSLAYHLGIEKNVPAKCLFWSEIPAKYGDKRLAINIFTLTQGGESRFFIDLDIVPLEVSKNDFLQIIAKPQLKQIYDTFMATEERQELGRVLPSQNTQLNRGTRCSGYKKNKL